MSAGDFRKIQQIRICWIFGLVSSRQRSEALSARDVVKHLSDFVWLDNLAQMGVSAGATNFLDLFRTGRQLISPLAPRLVAECGTSVRRDQSAEKQVAVEHDEHYCCLAHFRASSTADSMNSGSMPVFRTLTASQVNSKIRSRTASSTNAVISASVASPFPLDKNLRKSSSSCLGTCRLHCVAAVGIILT